MNIDGSALLRHTSLILSRRKWTLSAQQRSLWDELNKDSFLGGWPPNRASIKAGLDAVQACTGLNVVQSEGCSVLLAEILTAWGQRLQTMKEKSSIWWDQKAGPVFGIILLWGMTCFYLKWIYDLWKLTGLGWSFSICLVMYYFAFEKDSEMVLGLLGILSLYYILWLCWYLVVTKRAQSWFILSCLMWLSFYFFIWFGPSIVILIVLLQQSILWLKQERKFFSSKLELVTSHGAPIIRCSLVALRNGDNLLAKSQSKVSFYDEQMRLCCSQDQDTHCERNIGSEMFYKAQKRCQRTQSSSRLDCFPSESRSS